MKSTVLKAGGILISVSSVLLGIHWLWQFAQSTGPDRSLFIAPIFACGFPLTVLGSFVAFGFTMAGHGLWYDAVPVFICYLLQWQLISLWLYRKGRQANVPPRSTQTNQNTSTTQNQ